MLEILLDGYLLVRPVYATCPPWLLPETSFLGGDALVEWGVSTLECALSISAVRAKNKSPPRQTPFRMNRIR